jgi:TPR repeat protein
MLNKFAITISRGAQKSITMRRRFKLAETGRRSPYRCVALLVLLAFISADASAASWKLRTQADQAYQRHDYKTAFQKYFKLTKENGGNSYAECQLGIMYERGEGVQKDVSQSITWYQPAR